MWETEICVSLDRCIVFNILLVAILNEDSKRITYSLKIYVINQLYIDNE